MCALPNWLQSDVLSSIENDYVLIATAVNVTQFLLLFCFYPKTIRVNSFQSIYQIWIELRSSTSVELPPHYIRLVWIARKTNFLLYVPHELPLGHLVCPSSRMKRNDCMQFSHPHTQWLCLCHIYSIFGPPSSPSPHRPFRQFTKWKRDEVTGKSDKSERNTQKAHYFRCNTANVIFMPKWAITCTYARTRTSSMCTKQFYRVTKRDKITLYISYT